MKSLKSNDLFSFNTVLENAVEMLVPRVMSPKNDNLFKD